LSPDEAVAVTSHRRGDTDFPIYGLEMPRLGYARILDGWLNPQKPMFGENLRWLYRKSVAAYQYERIRTLNDINVRHN
jgi:hypothetical protein